MYVFTPYFSIPPFMNTKHFNHKDKGEHFYGFKFVNRNKSLNETFPLFMTVKTLWDAQK